MFYSFDCAMMPTVESFYSVTRNTVWQFTEHNHILLHITEGTCLISTDGSDYILEQGDVFYIPANHSYTRKSIDGSLCTMTYIHFKIESSVEQEEASVLAKKLLENKNKIENQVLIGNQNPDTQTNVYLESLTRSPKYSAELHQLFEKILYTSSTRRLLYNLSLSTDLCRILLLLSRETIDKLLSDDTFHNLKPVPLNLRRSIEYIIANYSKLITLNDLAQQCNVSKQQVIRYFKSELNTTPIQYLNNYRLSKSKELLFRHPELTIKEISIELGFENPHYFTRLFSSTQGETPSQYRARTTNYSTTENKT